MPIEGVVLQMKSMHIDAVVNFPFPTPPDRATLQQAEQVLTRLGALRPGVVTVMAGKDKGAVGGQVTELGKTMSFFPLSPRFSRMLVSGQQHGCLPYVVAIVSALSVGDPFLHDEGLLGDDNGVEGEGSEREGDGHLAHLTSEAARAKEARRLRRKSYFQSQQVRDASIAHR